MIELPRIVFLSAKKQARLPEVFPREEVRAILAQIEGKKWLMVSLLYGTGMRLNELLRLRVKDIDFQQNQITVRQGKMVYTHVLNRGGLGVRGPLDNR